VFVTQLVLICFRHIMISILASNSHSLEIIVDVYVTCIKNALFILCEFGNVSKAESLCILKRLHKGNKT
jgi:hypothetical protein